jgi:nucleoside-diphosphate-sugar epimerase
MVRGELHERGCEAVIFILGSKGFIGSAFCELCDERHISYRGIDIDNHDEFKGSSCDVLINADGNSKKYLAEEDPALEFKLSVSSVIHSLCDFKISKYIYLSSVSVYSDHTNPNNNHEESGIDISSQSNYGFHKYLAEQLVRKYCSNWLILRLGGMVGKQMTKGPVYDILNNIPLKVGPLSEFQFIDTAEVAKLGIRMLQENCTREIINICGRGTITLRKIQEMTGHVKDNDCPTEIWNVNTDKTHRRFGLLTTEEVVQKFISSFGISQGR